MMERIAVLAQGAGQGHVAAHRCIGDGAAIARELSKAPGSRFRREVPAGLHFPAGHWRHQQALAEPFAIPAGGEAPRLS